MKLVDLGEPTSFLDHVQGHRGEGGVGTPGWGSNAQKRPIRREFWGQGSVYSSKNWFWLQSGYDFTAVDDREGLSLR